MIPHSRPSLGQEEETAVRRVIRSGRLAQGPEVEALEREIAAQLEVSNAVAVSSGSAALHLALLAMDVGPNSRVAFPSYVCSALLNAVRHSGATPVLTDTLPDSPNIDPSDLSKRHECPPDVVIVPHMFGLPSEMNGLLDLGIPILEDCAMSVGANWKARPLGSWGAAGVLSFYATKLLCAGEGGTVITRDSSLANRVRDLRDYDGKPDERPRFNYKMTDIQAAIARIQLRKIDSFIERRRELAGRYSDALSGTESLLPHFETGSVPFRYVVRIPSGAESLEAEFETRGVAARRPVFRPIHRTLGLSDGEFPETRSAHHESLSIPLYPSLDESEITHILAVAGELL